MKRLLSGNEAVAHGAWVAGVSVASGYPGTPSTEILEVFATMPGVYAEWAPNEKVALDAAIGASYAGARALATMKHVGVNVAADAFFYASMTGVEGGLVLVSADDPSMHSSQNEQDNRQYAKFARVPCLDPADSQEAKDFMIKSIEISEEFDTPVILRLTTRVCHTSSPVEVSPDRTEKEPLEKFPRNHAKYVMIPANAIKKHPVIEDRLQALAEYAETLEINKVEERSKALGIITGGIAYQYAREVFPEASILKLGMVYPLPVKMITDFAAQHDKVIVLEELDPFIEEQVRLMGIELYSPENKNKYAPYPQNKGIFPLMGELDALKVRKAAEQAGLLPKSEHDVIDLDGLDIPNRPPVLCPGCPHRSTFYILNKLKVPVNGDIGCYTLGVVPPLSAIHTCGCMGASIAVAHGAVKGGSQERHVAVIGDSTFFHTGMPALMNVAYNQSNVITIIMDNRITSMTGQQENPGSELSLQNNPTERVDMEALVKAIGIDKVKTVEAYKVKEIETTLKAWVKEDGPAVLITDHACVLMPEERKKYIALEVKANCNGCTICFRIGCPAVLKSDKMDPKHNRPLAEIDPLLCTGCEICAQVCPIDAITFKDEMIAMLKEKQGL